MTERQRFGRTSRDLLRHGEPIRAEDEPVTLPNGWTGRIDALRRFVNEPGGVSVLVLGVFLGMAAGWIPSVLSRVEAKLDTHENLTAKRADRLADVLSQLASEIEKQNKRNRIRECAEITDLELRTRCLE